MQTKSSFPLFVCAPVNHPLSMRIILLLLSLASILQAAEGERTCRILFPGGPEQPAGKYYLFDGENSQEVTLPRLSFSPVYKLRPGDIKIWLLTRPIGKPEEIPAGSPEVTMNANTKDLYLLITTDPNNHVLPMRMQVVKADYDKIHLGEMLWFNLTQKPIAGKVGKSSLNLAPNSSALIGKPAASPGDYPVEIYFHVPNDDRIHPLIESQWYHDPRSRCVVFVFDEGRRRAPRVMSFSDFRLVEKKEDE
jgi:hypothetical protein